MALDSNEEYTTVGRCLDVTFPSIPAAGLGPSGVSVQAALLGWAILLDDRVVPLQRYPMNVDSFARNKHF